MRKKIVAIIPARGGSKGVPRKNIRPFCGKPLIYWTISEAQKSKYIDRIIVSTEDAEIKEVALSFGAEVYDRPAELARDETATLPVLLDVADRLVEEGYEPDYIILLQVTSPLRQVEHIDEAIESILGDDYFQTVRSMTENTYPAWWLGQIAEDGSIAGVFKYEGSPVPHRRQDFPKLYRGNGAIRIIRGKEFLEQRRLAVGKVMPYLMDEHSSVDIDSIEDFEYAEYLMRKVIEKDG